MDVESGLFMSSNVTYWLLNRPSGASFGRHWNQKRKLIRLLALAVVGLAMVVTRASKPVGAQTPTPPPTYVCFPTCATNDGRFLVIAGNDPTTMSGQSIEIGLNVAPDATTLQFGVFDVDRSTGTQLTSANGGAGAADPARWNTVPVGTPYWDKNVTTTKPPEIKLTLWANPDGVDVSLLPSTYK